MHPKKERWIKMTGFYVLIFGTFAFTLVASTRSEVVQWATMSFNPTIAQEIDTTFFDADRSLISDVLYFDGWTSYDASGGYLIFRGFDGALYCCEYGSTGSDEYSANAFLPVAITEKQYAECLKEVANVANVVE